MSRTCTRCGGNGVMPYSVVYKGIAGLCFRCAGSGIEPLTNKEKRQKQAYKSRAVAQGWAAYADDRRVVIRTSNGREFINDMYLYSTPEDARQAAWEFHFHGDFDTSEWMSSFKIEEE